MTVVVGYTPGKGGRGSLDLGLQLAHALDEPMAVVTVVPRSDDTRPWHAWTPSTGSSPGRSARRRNARPARTWSTPRPPSRST